jgi:hypothetical protein
VLAGVETPSTIPGNWDGPASGHSRSFCSLAVVSPRTTQSRIAPEGLAFLARKCSPSRLVPVRATEFGTTFGSKGSPEVPQSVACIGVGTRAGGMAHRHRFPQPQKFGKSHAVSRLRTPGHAV